MAKRINHKKLHEQLESMGYEIFTCDYSYGNHVYQISKENEWNEYSVVKKDGVKMIELYGVNPNLYELIKSYYKQQRINVC